MNKFQFETHDGKIVVLIGKDNSTVNAEIFSEDVNEYKEFSREAGYSVGDAVRWLLEHGAKWWTWKSYENSWYFLETYLLKISAATDIA